MKIRFQDKKFNADALAVLKYAVGVIENYKRMGYTLTLRQLYYQFVKANAFPSDRKYKMIDGKWVRTDKGSINAEPNYKWLGDIIADARMAGLVDWDMIEDRGRITTSITHWNSPQELLTAAAQGFQQDLWRDQANYTEVMCEKQALEGVLEPVCDELGIRFTSNKGYSSQTALFNTGQRLKRQFMDRAVRNGLLHADKARMRFPLENHMYDLASAGSFQSSNEFGLKDEGNEDSELHFVTEQGAEEGWPRIAVIYFGDHDPSGIDMTRDVAERLHMFSDGTPMEVHRVALNMDQIEELNPPENPAKETDSRAAKYIQKFGNSSWELDAVTPEDLARMVRNKIYEFRDLETWKKSVARVEKERAKIAKAIASIK